jgi:hypothetical protein
VKVRKTSAAIGACITVALSACGGDDHVAEQRVAPPFASFQAAALVLGQRDFVSGEENGGQSRPSGSALDYPTGLAVSADGVLFVSEWDNNRVLGFASGVSSANGAPATFVLGQNDVGSNIEEVTSTSHPGAESVRISGTRMAVAHHRAHRVVVFDTVPLAHGAQPDHLFGQVNHEQSNSGCGPQSLANPEDAFLTQDGKLLVADSTNHRVLIWNSLRSAQPDVVLGQGALNRCEPNDDNQDGTADGAPSARTLRRPANIWTDGTRLAVADTGNHRVLIWNRFPTSHFQPADLVLGQDSFTAAAFNDDDQDGLPDARPSSRAFQTPIGVDFDGDRLALADNDNNRVLIWDRFPTRNFQPADVVLGQATFAAAARNDADQDGMADALPSDRTLFDPKAVLFHKGDLVVGDSGNNRILVFRRLP